ncbi:restriction endonuclease subunit S [[Mycoplasma] phocae]|uniref:restriction endonuclease subunit S n=1 Tax=[Mycoplasma] phocae TaxID=142651 RepID=UPI003530A207
MSTGKSNTQDAKENGKYPFFVRSPIPLRSDEFLYDEEAIITIGEGAIGKVFHYIKGKFNLHQRCYKIYNFNNLNAKFIYYYMIQNFYNQVIKKSAKATVDSLRFEMIASMFVNYPKCNDEILKIIKLLDTTNNLISLHQCKKIDLKNFKINDLHFFS